jgi:16S rRNA (cytidine1402-2'-O)-methyltransferase
MSSHNGSEPMGCLYVVATPIGNLGDISIRAIEILKSVDYILAEDTRVSKRLLDAYAIATRLRSFHDHNEARVCQSVLDDINTGSRVALISDAGTPLLSDPGYLLVRNLHEAEMPVRVIPGPSALTAALSVAGLATRPVWFEGFLPAKHEARMRRLESLSTLSATLVFYEAPHRVQAALEDMCEVFGLTRKASFARELSKRFEQTRMGTLGSLCDCLTQQAPRGEFVVLVEGADETKPEDLELRRIVSLLLEELPTRKAATLAAAITGIRRNEAYQLALEIKEENSE